MGWNVTMWHRRHGDERGTSSRSVTLKRREEGGMDDWQSVLEVDNIIALAALALLVLAVLLLPVSRRVVKPNAALGFAALVAGVVVLIVLVARSSAPTDRSVGVAFSDRNLSTDPEDGPPAPTTATAQLDVDQLLLAAEQGNAEAQTELGSRYFSGEKGVRVDHEEAYYWLRRAAEQGNAEAQNTLGAMHYSLEFIVFGDNEKAVQWLRRAAEQGDANAQFNLGFLHEQGFYDGLPDLVEATMLYSLAAGQGHTEAQQALDRLR